jgi:thymidylate kinase
MKRCLIELVGVDGAGKSSVAKHFADRHGFALRKVAPFDDSFRALATKVFGAFGVRGVEVLKAISIGHALLREASSDLPDRVIFDRYIESARMYWNVKDLYPVPDEVLCQLPPPTAVVFLDLDPRLALKRRLRPSEATLEEERIYMDSCAAYLRGQAESCGWVRVDTAQPLEKSLQDLEDRVHPEIP